MDETDAIDPNVTDLVVRLCTRIGIMMEDLSPLALDASREGLERRVSDIASTTRAMAEIAAAAEALLS